MPAPDSPSPTRPSNNGDGLMRIIALASAIMFATIGLSRLTLAQTPARSSSPTVEDAALEKRALLIAEELRCLVCQNQTIADSNADLAIDLRKQIREQIVAGQSDAQIMDFMVLRFGDFVRYRPPVKFSTVMLWFGPFLLLLAGAIVVFKVAQQRRRMTARKLTKSEDQRAQELLEGGPAGADELVAPDLPGRH